MFFYSRVCVSCISYRYIYYQSDKHMPNCLAAFWIKNIAGIWSFDVVSMYSFPYWVQGAEPLALCRLHSHSTTGLHCHPPFHVLFWHQVSQSCLNRSKMCILSLVSHWVPPGIAVIFLYIWQLYMLDFIVAIMWIFVVDRDELQSLTLKI